MTCDAHAAGAALPYQLDGSQAVAEQSHQHGNSSIGGMHSASSGSRSGHGGAKGGSAGISSGSRSGHGGARGGSASISSGGADSTDSGRPLTPAVASPSTPVSTLTLLPSACRCVCLLCVRPTGFRD